MSKQYAALVEADCVLTFEVSDETAGDEDAIEAFLQDTVRTGHLGPVNVRSIEEDPMPGEEDDDA